MQGIKAPDPSTEQVFTGLVSEHQTSLLRMCYLILHDSGLAEDAVQETFVKAYRALPAFRGQSNHKTWLMRIAINTCRDMQRGSWLKHISRTVTLDELWMKNGFWKFTNGLDQYVRNSRVKKMTIFVRYAGSDDYQMIKDVTLKDESARKDWKVINLQHLQNATSMRIRIDEIFMGSKFPSDVCISEIMFVQHAEH